MKVVVFKVLNDVVCYVEVLRESDWEWVIVCGLCLMDEFEKGEYCVGWVGVNVSISIGWVDLVDFLFI